jgi:hypothetical protein
MGFDGNHHGNKNSQKWQKYGWQPQKGQPRPVVEFLIAHGKRLFNYCRYAVQNFCD